MSKKRLSLQSILDEERAELREGSDRDLLEKKTSSEAAAETTAKESKADFVRLSITISPADFDRLQTESLNRRKDRQTYTFSHLMRLALAEWLDKIENSRKEGE